MLLRVLVDRAGAPVSKETLMEAAWPGRAVEESNLTVQIAALRRALREEPGGERWIETLPRRGYRFLGPVIANCGLTIPTRVTAFPNAPGAKSRSTGPLPSLPVQLARMVGRDDTVRTIMGELSAHRFVTVVGPGGIGKTTVATAVGHALSFAFSDQVAFVDLGPLSEPRLVSSAVGSALGLMVSSEEPVASLIASVQHRRLLLILDSCEHVIEPLAILAEQIFKAADSVHILATSREALRAEGERVHRLLPLRYPPRGEKLNASDVLNFPAVQLFIDRVTAASGGFELTDADAPIVSEICRRLDGIPLALELAAGRVDVFGISGLAARLDDRLILTTRGRRTATPRHQTLRATLDWSYDRLPTMEQLLLNRLSIFNGDFTFAAAADVCSGEGLPEIDLADCFADLVAKSLVSANLGMEASYRLLDTTRSYASEMLEKSREREALAESHARYICTLFEFAAKQWDDNPSTEWVASYRPQIDNLRAALKWAFSENGDPGLGVALTIAAVPLWSQLSLVDESLDWVERALSASAGLQGENRRRKMQLYAALGGLQMYAVSSVKQSNNAWEAVLTLATELGEIEYQLRAVRALWAEAINTGRFKHALSLAERFQELAVQSDNVDDQIVSDRLIGTAQHFLGEQEKAQATTERMLSRYVASAARSHIVRYQFNQKVSARIIRGRVLWMLGRTESALRDIEENVSEALALDHTMSLCNVLTQSACPVALLAGELDTARRYVDVLRERTAPRALDIWYTYAVCFDAALDIERGNVAEGLYRLQPAMEKLLRSGFGHYRTSFLMMRARSLLLLDRGSDADAAITEAVRICESTGERWCLPELHRLRGEILLNQKGCRSVDAAVEAYQHALSLARDQQALAWELRAAFSLARLRSQQNCASEARALLAPVYARFTEGHSTADLRCASDLLDQL
jgi:predicted ATPase